MLLSEVGIEGLILESGCLDSLEFWYQELWRRWVRGYSHLRGDIGVGRNSCRDPGHVRAAVENSQATGPSGSLPVDSYLLHCGFALDLRANTASSESHKLATKFSVKRKMNKLNSTLLCVCGSFNLHKGQLKSGNFPRTYCLCLSAHLSKIKLLRII